MKTSEKAPKNLQKKFKISFSKKFQRNFKYILNSINETLKNLQNNASKDSSQCFGEILKESAEILSSELLKISEKAADQLHKELQRNSEKGSKNF